MSIFGEIQTESSRAVSDDEDDEFSQLKEDQSLKRKVYWIDDKSQLEKFKVDELIIADGALSCAFLHTYFLNHLHPSDLTLLGLTAILSEFKIYQINQQSNLENKNENSAKMRSNFVYLLNNLNGKSYVICQLYNQLKPNEIYDWINQLSERVDFKKSLLFTALNRTAYFGKNEEKFPLVKYISSEKPSIKDANVCVRLEEPNFLGNLPAAIIHYCLSKNLPFLTFVCYTASLGVDLNSIKEISKAVKAKLSEANIFIENDLSKKTLLNLERLMMANNSVYM